MMNISKETAHIIAEMIEGHRDSSNSYDPQIESELVDVSNLVYDLRDECEVTIEVVYD